MRTFLLVFFGCFSGAVLAAEAEEASDVVDRLINTTDLGKNIQTLDDYYEQVNQKLNNKINNRQRDPFEKLIQSKSEVEPKSAKPRFIPRQMKDAPLEGESLSKPMLASKSREQLPVMQFRGFIKSDAEKAGLLEIEGQGTFVVHEGDKVGLQQLGGDMVVRVVEINALNLIVEFGSLGEKVVVQ